MVRFLTIKIAEIMKVTIDITEQEIKDLKLIRNYFGENDKTMLEHLAYYELDKLVKKLTIPDVVKSLPQDNFCIVCNLPTDGEKCYSKRCPV